MLNPFPSLLVYGFFMPTLLRLAVAVSLIYVAYFLLRERAALEALRIPIAGKMRGWMVWFSVIVTLLVAFLLFIGLETQWAALVGLLILLKHLYATKNYKTYLPFSRAAYVLLFILCFSLLFSGAGAFAFDLPL